MHDKVGVKDSISKTGYEHIEPMHSLPAATHFGNRVTDISGSVALT